MATTFKPPGDYLNEQVYYINAQIKVYQCKNSVGKAMVVEKKKFKKRRGGTRI